MNWELAYKVGFHPWEDAAEDPVFREKILSLFEREESLREPPYGRALDLGTGSGIWGIELAERGWDVTGIDIVKKALRRASENARQAGVDIRLIHGDVTALEQTDVASDFHLVLDTGTFHDLDDEGRKALGRGVNAVAAADATLMLLVWPRRRRPLIRGARRRDVEAAFLDWVVTDIEPSHFRLPRILDLLMRPDEHWYRLRRR